ncbi:LuxR C-terminal-related transcriptional regulator [Paenibacillus sp. NPDC058174]|uniref:LuxR C-terminal-related transcriptional regulator n=1 Tax=Paenibacillus sp. NPDC058174 TaxID=3346366 RepID=UPI0036DDB8C3
MNIPIITKLYIPPSRPRAVHRIRLHERMDEGLHGKLTLVSAAAGFGKTTLVSDWLAACSLPAAWLSLDEGDNDPARFLTCLFSAVQTIGINIGEGVFGMLQSPQPPPAEALMAVLIREITAAAGRFILVLDDYHVIAAEPVQQALAFLLEHQPPQMHLVIAARENPDLPLARLRVRNQLTELRAADLRFTPAEAAGFLNQTMGLNLSAPNAARLADRTEGWAAGLQLAALSLRGLEGSAEGDIDTFTGSHRFVLDYIIEEVLKQQPESIQTFLLQTSILDRLCGPLCEAVMGKAANDSRTRGELAGFGQEVLEYLEHANLFIIPLDNERRWFRYHHLFADALRLQLKRRASALSGSEASGLHIAASEWYEEQGMELEAFRHAAEAGDVDRSARLIEGAGMPLQFRGEAVPILNWLESLPPAVKDARPSLYITHASALLLVSRTAGVEPMLQAAERVLQHEKQNEQVRDLIGHIASIRATLAVGQQQPDAIYEQSLLALASLHPDNLPVRTAAAWTLGYAQQLRGDYAAAGRTYAEALLNSEQIGHRMIAIMAAIGLGNVQELNKQPDLAAESYRYALQLGGEPPLPVVSEAYLGLARIALEREGWETAEQHAQQALLLARQIENTDRFVSCKLVFARVKLAQGKIAAAAAILSETEQLIIQHHFVQRQPELAELQKRVQLHEGKAETLVPISPRHALIEPLSERELEILKLIAEGLSNQEICDRLFLALSTVKGYNRNLFGKLQVQRRTEAVARARELDLL